MNVISVLTAVLYVISSLLLYPVMLCLVFVFAFTLYAGGGFLAEWGTRRRSAFLLDPFLTRLVDWIESHRSEAAPCCAPTIPTEGAIPPFLARFFSAVVERLQRADQQAGLASAEPDAEIAFVLREEEERLRRGTDRLRVVVKVGPSLGLLGTLIPMGTALAALATGNLEVMAREMVIAFVATVVGLASGTLAFVMSAVKGRWTAQDLNRLTYSAERLSASASRARQESRT